MSNTSIEDRSLVISSALAGELQTLLMKNVVNPSENDVEQMENILADAVKIAARLTGVEYQPLA